MLDPWARDSFSWRGAWYSTGKRATCELHSCSEIVWYEKWGAEAPSCPPPGVLNRERTVVGQRVPRPVTLHHVAELWPRDHPRVDAGRHGGCRAGRLAQAFERTEAPSLVKQKRGSALPSSLAGASAASAYQTADPAVRAWRFLGVASSARTRPPRSSANGACAGQCVRPLATMQPCAQAGERSVCGGCQLHRAQSGECKLAQYCSAPTQPGPLGRASRKQKPALTCLAAMCLIS